MQISAASIMINKTFIGEKITLLLAYSGNKSTPNKTNNQKSELILID